MNDQNAQNQFQKVQPEQTSVSEKKNIGMAIIAYIIFFIPLLTDAKNDPFVKYHVKQGLVLFIGWIAAGLVSILLAFVPPIGGIIAWLLNVSLFVLMVFGIVSATKGEQKPLPVIGQFGEKFKF